MSTPPPPPNDPNQPPNSQTGTSRKPWWRRWWVIVIGVIIVFAVIAGIVGEEESDDSGSSPAAATTATTTAATTTPATTTAAAAGNKVGDTVTVTDRNNEAQVTVANLRPVQPLRATDSATRSFFAATVTITVTKGEWTVNPLYFAFYTVDGTQGSLGMTSATDLLRSSTQPEGATVRGDVDVSVPAGQTIARIVMSGVLGRPQATWTVG